MNITCDTLQRRRRNGEKLITPPPELSEKDMLEVMKKTGYVNEEEGENIDDIVLAVIVICSLWSGIKVFKCFYMDGMPRVCVCVCVCVCVSLCVCSPERTFAHLCVFS